MFDIRLPSNLTEIQNRVENMKLYSHFYEERCIMTVDTLRNARNYTQKFPVIVSEYLTLNRKRHLTGKTKPMA
jgi:hypothetical protein